MLNTPAAVIASVDLPHGGLAVAFAVQAAPQRTLITISEGEHAWSGWLDVPLEAARISILSFPPRDLAQRLMRAAGAPPDAQLTAAIAHKKALAARRCGSISAAQAAFYCRESIQLIREARLEDELPDKLMEVFWGGAWQDLIPRQPTHIQRRLTQTICLLQAAIAKAQEPANESPL